MLAQCDDLLHVKAALDVCRLCHLVGGEMRVPFSHAFGVRTVLREQGIYGDRTQCLPLIVVRRLAVWAQSKRDGTTACSVSDAIVQH